MLCNAYKGHVILQESDMFLYKAYEGRFTRDSNCTIMLLITTKADSHFSGLNVWKHHEIDVSAPRMTRSQLRGFKVFTLELMKIQFFCDMLTCRNVNNYLSSEGASCLFRQDARSSKRAWNYLQIK